MSEHLESLVNVKKIEEIKSKEEANRYLELGWKLLKIAEEREKDEGGYYNVVIYCVGWYSSEEPKYSKKQKIDIHERRPYLKTKRRGTTMFILKWLKIIIYVGILISSVYLTRTYFCPQQPPPDRTIEVPPTETLPERPFRTILRWIALTGDVLDGNVLSPGKHVELEEIYNDDIGPRYFDVFEVYDTIFDRLIRQRYGSLALRAKLDVNKVQDWIMHSDRPWQLPAPSEFRGQSTFRFSDDREKWSDWITSACLGKIIFRMQSGIREPGIFEVKGGAEIEMELIFASDPEVSLVLLVPWGRAEANLKDYLFEYLYYLEELYPEIHHEAFIEQFGGYLPSERPEGWELTVSPQIIAGSPLEPGKFTLRLTTPTPGKTFLAIKAIHSGDPSCSVVSEIIGIDGAPD
jgi:hypothetical protein